MLDALRENLHLTGTKKGCDHGQCGACTVILDGRRINSCLTLAVMHEGGSVTTVEGLGTPQNLHPMQTAFVKHDGYQCGFCTPGQICSAVAVLEEIKAGIPSHWPVGSADAIVCINMIHIAPWSATRALMRGASITLGAGHLLYLYGPYRVRGRYTSASNRAFDTQLRGAHADWGVRDLDEVTEEARAAGFDLFRTFEMPANNLSVVFRKI